jgi:hypothetical protein
MITHKKELKHELIKLRQSPDYPNLRNLTRRTIKYIEKLEKRIGVLESRDNRAIN